MRLLRAWIAVGLLGSTACRSTLEAVRSPEEPGQALARFEGTLGLPERELRRAAAADLEDLALSVTEETRTDPAHADDAAFAVEAALRAAGFPDAVCTFQLDPASGAVTLSVEAGPRCVLEEVELLGGPQLLPRNQLALLFEGPRLGLLGRGEPVFVETRVRSAPRAIVREYRARGHLEAAVSEPVIELSEDRTRARITVTIEEGPRRTLGVVRAADPRTEQAVPGFDELVEALTAVDANGERTPFTPRVPARTIRSAPRRERSSVSVADVASGEMATVSRIATGPVSSPASMRMTQTPVCASPAMIARCTGAAPRQRGNSEAWRLKAPASVASSARCGRMRP